MIKSDLVWRIRHQNPHLYLQDVEKIVDALFDEITASLARGKRIELRGFGTFSVKVHEARIGRNPGPARWSQFQKRLTPISRREKRWGSDSIGMRSKPQARMTKVLRDRQLKGTPSSVAAVPPDSHRGLFI